MHVPDPAQNCFIPDPRDSAIWLEALSAWCQRYEEHPERRGVYAGVEPADVQKAAAQVRDGTTPRKKIARAQYACAMYRAGLVAFKLNERPSRGACC